MSEEFKVGDYAIVRGATRYKDGPLCSKGWPPECTFGDSFSYAEGSLGKVVSVNPSYWTSMSGGKLNLLLALFHLETHYCGEHTNFSLFCPGELVKIDPESLRQETEKIKREIWDLKHRSLDELVEAYQRGFAQLKDIEYCKQGIELLRADMPNREEYERARKVVRDHYNFHRRMDKWRRDSIRKGGYIGALTA